MSKYDIENIRVLKKYGSYLRYRFDVQVHLKIISGFFIKT